MSDYDYDYNEDNNETIEYMEEVGYDLFPNDEDGSERENYILKSLDKF